jgi:hypothetical protein
MTKKVFYQSTIELLCVPFLDADTSQEQIRANAILASRGYSKILIKILRFFCAIGLWTQALIWEEYQLGIFDVVLGYSLLFIFISMFVFLVGFIKIGFCILAIGLILLTSLFAALYIKIHWNRKDSDV